MATPAFDSLSTEKFRVGMRPYAEAIYKAVFPGCEIKDLRKDGVKVHVLDQEFAIDTQVVLPSNQWMTVQEKYRTHDFLVNKRYRVDPSCPDFTQEYMNAAGTKHEEHGEWFKLAAQLYFYGWANESKTAFSQWFIMDVTAYKLMVESSGGLSAIGKLQHNRQHGRATFYAIPVSKLASCVLSSKNNPRVLTITSSTGDATPPATA